MQQGVEIINGERNVDVANIARPEVEMFSIGRREIFQQLDLVTARNFEHGELECAGLRT